MTKFYEMKIALCALLLFGIHGLLIGQVGVATNSPQGMLDVSNSNLAGIVFPKAALIATNVQAPVINPIGGNLAPGTIVFNTSDTSAGQYDVYPGIYAWDGSRWRPQYLIEQAQTFVQSSLNFRPVFTNGFVDVPGLGNGSQFTAKYTGIYRVKANFNFGAGRIKAVVNGDVRMQTQEGYFRFVFDGDVNDIYTHAYSLHNISLPSSERYVEGFRHDSTLILYKELNAGETYDFKLQIDVILSTGFVNNGNSGSGRAYVGIGVPCTVEFTYLEEN